MHMHFVQGGNFIKAFYNKHAISKEEYVLFLRDKYS